MYLPARPIKTLIVASFIAVTPAFADLINQENLKTHMRWNLMVPRDQIYVTKKDQNILIETVNLQLFEDLAGDLAKLKINDQYITNVSYSKDNFPAKPATIEVKLKDPAVELFSFYRDADKKYILDFWINNDLKPMDTPSFKKPLSLPKVSQRNQPRVTTSPTTNVAPSEKNSILTKKSKTLPTIEVTQISEKKEVAEYRDFRYGADFIWDYTPMIPQLEKDILLSSKIPDSLYPIEDRVNLDDPKEAHLQLTINFYREGKFGLMNKSITLYEKKYGRDSNGVLNEFLKANALLRDNLARPNRGITQSAMVILSNIKDMTEDYELKSAILRYLIQYNSDVKDHVRTLELSKQLFVASRANFDQTMVIQSAITILHALGELKQVDKIEEFMADKKLMSILPPQVALAYVTFALLIKGDTKELIKRFKSVEKSLAKPVHPTILYNVAEAYFRHADYLSAISYYDEFLAGYSYVLQAPHARLRLALAYELMDKDIGQNLTLYKNAIDRSTAPAIRYEAKLRYVAFRIARKFKPDADDLETEVFLEQSPDESKAMDPNLKKLLWLVRLRIFISGKKYDEALAYLTSLPLDSVKPAERRVFEGDGAEIIFGLVNEAYLKEDYSKVIKLWEVYKDKYETKVAKNPYLNFVVCEAFLKLGLFKSFERSMGAFKSAHDLEERNYPIWVDRLKSVELAKLVEELNIIRLVSEKDWARASTTLNSIPVSHRDSLNYPFYLGQVFLSEKKYEEAALEFEKVLIKQNPQNRLTPRQTADLLMGYVDALYQLKDQNRFRTVVKALSEDVSKSKSAPILNISERINYLLIETYAGDESPNWKEIESMAKEFKMKFTKSPYASRVGFLYGLALIKNAKVSEGKEVLSLLRDDKTVPAHIKEMVSNELTTLELAEKKL